MCNQYFLIQVNHGVGLNLWLECHYSSVMISAGANIYELYGVYNFSNHTVLQGKKKHLLNNIKAKQNQMCTR